MADQDEGTTGAAGRGGGRARPGAAASGGGAGGGGGGAGTGGAGRSGSSRNRNRGRSRNRSRAGSGAGKSGAGGGEGRRDAGGKGAGSGTKKSGARGAKTRQGAGGRPSGQGGGRRSGTQGRGGGGEGHRAVALAPAPPPEALDAPPSLGALQIDPREGAVNRRRAVRLCAYTAVVPALLLGVLLGLVVSLVAGVVAFVVIAVATAYGIWRVAPSVALGRLGAVPVDEHDDPRLYNVTGGLCATFGLSMPSLHVLDDDVPNACALGRDARRADVVVTTGLLRRVDPIELEGVIAHELAHVKRGDNGVSCVGITLATMFGGERTLRRCVGESREYRADVVGASAVRYPRGLLDALGMMTGSPPPTEGSFFATPSRFGTTRWVWIDPSVGHRHDPLEPGDLDATSVRAAALSEW